MKNNFEVSPLGSFAILLLAQSWNELIDPAKKESIRQSFLSDNALEVVAGFDSICELTTYFHEGAGPDRIFQGDIFIRDAIVFLNGIKDPAGSNLRKDRDKILSDVRRDVVFYFAMMFKAGYFEQLPLSGLEIVLPAEKSPQ